MSHHTPRARASSAQLPQRHGFWPRPSVVSERSERHPARVECRQTREYVYAELGVLRLRGVRQMPPLCAPTMKPVGKPDAASPPSGLMSGDWKRNYGANCDTGMGESRRQTGQHRGLRSPRQSSTLLHRLLCHRDIANRVLDAASILVDRRCRRAKTDRLDAAILLRTLMALERSEVRSAGWCACRASSRKTTDAAVGNGLGWSTNAVSTRAASRDC